MVTPVALSPRHWLDAPAAAAWDRMVAASGGVVTVAEITDAGRTYAEQAAIYAQWRRERFLPKRLRRYKGSAAEPGYSKHESGRALDLHGDTLAWVIAHGAEFGWIAWRVPGEEWHVEYVASRDRHAGESAQPTRAAAPEPTPTPRDPEEDDDMYELIDRMYRELNGRAPDLDGAAGWLEYGREHGPKAMLGEFRKSTPERGTVDAAFRAHLGHGPSPEALAIFLALPTIAEVWRQVEGSQEAIDRRAQV